jgi:hypothetical protein
MPKLIRHTLLATLALTLAVAGIGCRDADLTLGRARPCVSCVGGRVQGVAVTRPALAQQIRSHLVSEEGCTLDPRTGRPVGPINAYAVSREGYELRLAELPRTGQIEEYLRRHDAVLSSEPVYVGAWHDRATGAYYLDLSELVADRALAEARGRAHGQQCIYHLATGSEIRLR